MGSKNLTKKIALTVLCIVSAASAAERMTSEELKSLFATGVTECGKYESGVSGALIEFCEYYRSDGTVIGMDEPSGRRYTATYEIREDGCQYFDDGSAYWTGCYYFEHKSGNLYIETRPDGNTSEVTIVEGNTQNLK